MIIRIAAITAAVAGSILCSSALANATPPGPGWTGVGWYPTLDGCNKQGAQDLFEAAHGLLNITQTSCQPEGGGYELYETNQ